MNDEMSSSSSTNKQQQKPVERQRKELCRLYSKPKSRNSMIRIALAPRTTRSGKVFDSRRYSTMKNLASLIEKEDPKEDEIPNEVTKSLSEGDEENKMDEDKSKEKVLDENESKVEEDQHLVESGTSTAKQTAEEMTNDIPPNSPIVIREQIGNEEQNKKENDSANIGKENDDDVVFVKENNDDVVFVKENDLKPLLVGTKNKRRAEPIKVQEVHPSLKLLPKVPCIKISTPTGSEKNEKTVRWADDNGQGAEGLSQIKEFEEDGKPRRRCTMFHKVNG